MKRLVYSPSVKVWVKTDSGVVDLSSYVTNCNIERKIGDVSSVEVFFRNPKVRDDNGKPRFLFTQKVQNDGNVGPVFHPMDPITVVLERIKGRPVQVFTGYCDTVPYVQLFPGTARLTASCTLKRLLYTYWDPALPFVAKFMQAYGWALGGDGVARKGDGSSFQTDSTDPATNKSISEQVKASGVNDSSIGNLLYAVLHEIGGWNDNNIYIQPLPSNIGSTVAKLMEEFTEDNKRANEEVSKLLQDIVGSGKYGSASAGGGVNAGPGGGETPSTGSNAGISGQELPAGVSTFENKLVASWIVPILQWARQHGWTGTITSGYRTVQHNQEIGGSPTSNHLGTTYPRGAIDVGGPNDAAEGAAFARAIKDYQKHNPGKPTLIQGVNTPFDGYPHDLGHFSATGN